MEVEKLKSLAVNFSLIQVLITNNNKFTTMKISEIAEKLDLKTIVNTSDAEISSGYVSDLLSDVVANAREGAALITIQVHRNVVAVANLIGLGAVIITDGRVPEESVLDSARENDVNIFSSESSAYTVAGKLYEMGIK